MNELWMIAGGVACLLVVLLVLLVLWGACRAAALGDELERRAKTRKADL